MLINMIPGKDEIKKQVIGEDADLESSGRILNRVIKWGRDGITTEADQKLAREILKDLDLERANHAPTPCTVERRNEDNATSDGLWGENNANRVSAKPNTIGTMRVMVTTRAECR